MKDVAPVKPSCDAEEREAMATEEAPTDCDAGTPDFGVGQLVMNVFLCFML